MTDQQNSAVVDFGNFTQCAEDRAHFVGAVHIDLSTQKRLNRVDNQQFGLIFANGTLNAVVCQGEHGFAVVNDQHAVKVGACMASSASD